MAEKRYLEDIVLNSNNPKKNWELINNVLLLNKSTDNPREIKFNQAVFEDELSIPNAFSNYSLRIMCNAVMFPLSNAPIYFF